MNRTLILMRHAKSDWGNPMLSDHDRSLNPRGQRAAKSLGTWLRRRGLTPDQVLSSTATRTQETYQGLALSITPTYLRDLYLAESDEMWATLAGATGECVLMIGHNPGIAEFATELVSQNPDHPRFQDYPTGATLVVAFDAAAWTQVKPSTGRVVDFIIPRELPD